MPEDPLAAWRKDLEAQIEHESRWREMQEQQEKEEIEDETTPPAALPLYLQQQAGTIAGALTLNGEHAMPGVEVTISKAGNKIGTRKTRSDGTFTFTALAPDTYDLKTPSLDARKTITWTVTVSAGQTRGWHGQLLGTISGNLTLDGGKPAPVGTQVTVYPANAPMEPVNRVKSAQTREDGAFTTLELPEGFYSVKVTSPDGQQTFLTRRNLQVSEGRRTQLNVQLYGTIKGTVKMSGGNLAVNAEVVVYNLGGDDEKNGSQTDAKGEFGPLSLFAGSYTVKASGGGEEGQKDVTVTAGQQATVDLTLA